MSCQFPRQGNAFGLLTALLCAPSCVESISAPSSPQQVTSGHPASCFHISMCPAQSQERLLGSHTPRGYTMQAAASPHRKKQQLQLSLLLSSVAVYTPPTRSHVRARGGIPHTPTSTPRGFEAGRPTAVVHKFHLFSNNLVVIRCPSGRRYPSSMHASSAIVCLTG